jgi:hypothetical protein
VRGLEATLPPAFSLLKSEFNDFLFAPIGEEKNGLVVTVLSAFARLGVDPWQESARLRQLSTAMATQRLTSIISGLPNGQWVQADVGGIAARLIGLLPATGAAELPLRETASGKQRVSPRTVTLLFVAILGGLMLLTTLNRLRSTADVNADNAVPSAATAPLVPLAGSK